jgi:hypothetical protein
VLAANSELIGLYRGLGDLILERQRVDGSGTKVVERFSSDLRVELPRSGPVAHELDVHAALGSRLARPGSCPATRGTIAMGP